MNIAKTKFKTPRQYSLVKFNPSSLDEKYHSQLSFSLTDVFVYFGEIPNMPGHCVISDIQTGQIVAGCHTWNFVELTEEEV